MGTRFNPPPGWDVPENFSPDPGWAPDPTWPAPPENWQWWVPEPAPPAPTTAAPAFVIPPRPDDGAPDAVDPVPPATRVRGGAGRKALVPALVAGAVLLVAGVGAGAWALLRPDATHDITGTLLVNDFGPEDEGCMGGDAVTRLDRLEALIDGQTFPCPQGVGGGYDDIRDGADVTVKDGAGELLGTGVLTGGTATDVGVTFAFTVEGVPDSDFYQVEVSHRGALSYSRAELEDAGWVVEASLG